MTRERVAEVGGPAVSDTPYVERYRQRMSLMQAHRAPVIHLAKGRRPIGFSEFPFASVSVLVILLSLFLLSMHLGGWTWSSWTYAFSLAIVVPLAVIELKRKAVITGGAVLLLVVTVMVDAGLPQYFGYSPSHLSFYDLTAHFLAAMFLTLFLWSVLWWTFNPSGPSAENGRRIFWFAVVTVLLVSVLFEFVEFVTDEMFGWGNFHAGVDTAGDIIFDVAGVMAAAFMISRHRVSALRRPFWHSERAAA